MNENGYYTDWIEFSIVITPGWIGPDVVIKGKFKDKYADVKTYLEELFYNAVNEEYKEE